MSSARPSLPTQIRLSPSPFRLNPGVNRERPSIPGQYPSLPALTFCVPAPPHTAYRCPNDFLDDTENGKIAEGGFRISPSVYVPKERRTKRRNRPARTETPSSLPRLRASATREGVVAMASVAHPLWYCHTGPMSSRSWGRLDCIPSFNGKTKACPAFFN